MLAGALYHISQVEFCYTMEPKVSSKGRQFSVTDCFWIKFLLIKKFVPQASVIH